MTACKPVLLLALAVLACREATAPLEPADFVGTYQLRTVNGRDMSQTVPATPDSCSWSFRYGSVILGDGAFSLYLYGTLGCPGEAAVTGVPGMIGGGVTVRGSSLWLTAIDPTSPAGAVMTLETIISGTDAIITFPPGVMHLANATSLAFGPRQASQ